MPPKHSSSTGNLSVPIQIIERRIYLIRGEKVMIDFDLAELYGVEIKVLNQAVKRHRDRFPSDFMFQLNKKESESLRSQIVTLKHAARDQHRKYFPYDFTEHVDRMCTPV